MTEYKVLNNGNIIAKTDCFGHEEHILIAKLENEESRELVDWWCYRYEVNDRNCPDDPDYQHCMNHFLAYIEHSDAYEGIDNCSGDCWVETFKTLDACVKWLIGDYADSSDVIGH